jgi:hypothetical protein
MALHPFLFAQAGKFADHGDDALPRSSGCEDGFYQRPRFVVDSVSGPAATTKVRCFFLCQQLPPVQRPIETGSSALHANFKDHAQGKLMG